jgi:thymidylate synthase
MTKIIYNEKLTSKNVDVLWLRWLERLLDIDDSDKQGNCDVAGECINAISVLTDPRKNIMKNKTRDMSIDYAIHEALWYESCEPTLDSIRMFTKAWDRMSDDGLTVNSNYGYCIRKKFGFDQLEYVYNLLCEDSGSRQAVIHIKQPSDQKSNDVNCTVCLQFLLRDGLLHMTVYMRSNDMWLGFPYDVFQFTNLQMILAMKLGVGLGTYTHICGSLHLYEKDAKELRRRYNV